MLGTIHGTISWEKNSGLYGKDLNVIFSMILCMKTSPISQMGLWGQLWHQNLAPGWCFTVVPDSNNEWKGTTECRWPVTRTLYIKHIMISGLMTCIATFFLSISSVQSFQSKRRSHSHMTSVPYALFGTFQRNVHSNLYPHNKLCRWWEATVYFVCPTQKWKVTLLHV